MLLKPEYASLGERVVEYPYVLETLIEVAATKKQLQLLDVGCVLNNKLIAPYVQKMVNNIWLLNPSLESIQYSNNVIYILNDIRRCNLPETLKYDVVTCISVIEHIGMDNTRYRGGKKEFEGECKHPEKFAIEALTEISKHVKLGGKLLISVPFGVFEYVYIMDKPNEPIYYSFDKEMIVYLKESLVGFETELIIYKVVPQKGWVKTSINDDRILKYAEQCVGAGAVAFIEGVKNR